MSLGFAKDSALNLADLIKSKESNDSLNSDDADTSCREGDNSEVNLAKDSMDLTSARLNLAALKKEGIAKAQDSFNESEASSGMPPSRSEENESSNGNLSDRKADTQYSPSTQYAGFNVDYSDYAGYDMEYNVDPYAPTVFGKKEGGGNIFCCLFAPWFGGSEPDKIEEEYENETASPELSGKESVETKTSRDEDDVSTGSEMYGEKLTEQDRLAAIARLGLPEIDSAQVDASASTESRGLLNEVQPFDTHKQGSLEMEEEPKEISRQGEAKTQEDSDMKPPKGILKRGSSMNKMGSSGSVTSPRSKSAASGQRRSLFAVTYEKKPHQDKHARFAPMARVVTVKSCNEMSYLDKSMIWWQKSDYDSFKKSGRLIAKAMLEGGSEIWLANTSRGAKTPPLQHHKSEGGKRSYHLSDRQELRQVPGELSSSEDYGSKWWCKFGHSRRGLEHIASMDEGRQRQNNVRAAIRAVLDEQRKQKMYDREDPEKLRIVGLQNTSWARDLALAAGAADAESVRSNFSEGAKSREFYLLKQATASVGTVRQVPDFMDPASSFPRMLDANTSSQIRFRRKQIKVSPAPVKEDGIEEPATMEAIHDTDSSGISKKAAAFGTESKDMAAVLSGMGDVERAPQRTSVGAH